LGGLAGSVGGDTSTGGGTVAAKIKATGGFGAIGGGIPKKF
jgi:hypothetical protein